jgi:hypothetical protein
MAQQSAGWHRADEGARLGDLRPREPGQVVEEMAVAVADVPRVAVDVEDVNVFENAIDRPLEEGELIVRLAYGSGVSVGGSNEELGQVLRIEEVIFS